MRVSFEFFYFFICYYYYHYCFIASRRSFYLTYIYFNFENTFFGLSNLKFFIESLYASIYVYSFYSFLFFSLSLFSFFLFSFFLIIFLFFIIIIIIIIIIVYVYVFSMCTDPVEKRLRFPQGFESCSVIVFENFFIFVLLNCESL